MPSQSYQGHYQTVPTGGNPRQTEAWALTEAARRIKEAQREPVDTEALLQAARLNWRLWTIFQAEMTSPDCQLPLEIRQNMISLCNFVDKVTVDFISDTKPEKLDVLININREIASGLLTTPPSDEDQAAAEDQPEAASADGFFDESA